MVGLGDTKKKIQQMVDNAEKLYARMNELRSEVDQLRQDVQKTSEQVDGIELDIAEQRVLLEALAEEQELEVDELIAAAAIEEVDEGATDDASTAEESGGSAGATDDASTAEGAGGSAGATDGETGDAAGGTAAEPED
jgi:chromosome segregation ATPase